MADSFGSKNGIYTFAGWVAAANEIELSANVNNYPINSQSFNAITNVAEGLVEISGFGAETEGTLSSVYIRTASDFGVVLKHESESSEAANRFNFSTGADITLPPWRILRIHYADGRWRN